MTTVGEELPKEVERVRAEVMPAYQSVGQQGAVVLGWMRASVDRAEKAMASGDVVEMVRAYKELRGYSL